MKLGDKVYLPEYNIFGKITEISGDRVAKIQYMTPEGWMTIDTLKLVVLAIQSINSIIQIARKIWNRLRKDKD